MNIKSIITVIILFVMAVMPTSAQLSVADIISSNMVLQRERPVPVWGKAAAGERITVSFGKQRVKTKAAADGSWRVSLKPMAADATPQTLTVKGKKNTLTFDNVVVGEVWIASGQSNMEYSMKRHKSFVAPKYGVDSAEVEMTKPSNPMIRVYVSDRKRQKPWAEASSESLPKVSTVGYYFAKNIQEALNVPVGIITAAVGGTRIEAWTTKEAYLSSPQFADEIKARGRVSNWGVGDRYAEKMASLVPFAVRGFLWYQGESNCGAQDYRYAAKQKVLVESWREAFGVPDAPFYYVLIAPHVYSDRKHKGTSRPATAEMLPHFVEQQMAARDSVGNTDYISVADLVDDIHDIHPSYKWTVGARMARLALSKTYGREGIICHSPALISVKTDGDALLLTFDNVGEGLKTNNNRRLRWFEVAGSDGVFRAAAADITSPVTVKVFAPGMNNPRCVRYCRHETAMPNLVNSAGLPALPFGSREAGVSK